MVERLSMMISEAQYKELVQMPRDEAVKKMVEMKPEILKCRQIYRAKALSSELVGPGGTTAFWIEYLYG